MRSLGAALALSLMSAMAAGPAGAWELVSSTDPGLAYEIYDDQDDKRGANCLYESGSSDLDRITIRGPQNVHGVGPKLQWIGYRYIIQRDAPPTGDGFVAIYKSPILYAKADDNENPRSWARRTWTAPETTSGDYRVLVVMFWYTRNSHASSALTDKVVIRYEWYKQKWQATFDVDKDYCGAEYT
jgi:hypothetical protein